MSRRVEETDTTGVTRDEPPAEPVVGDPGRVPASPELTGQPTTVVGGGIGGLAVAAELAASGADVTLLEANERVGGAANLIESDGYRFDTGPSWYLMPGAFERFFARFGEDPTDYYDLTRLDPNYRVFWKDGDRADVRADRAYMRELFESYESGAGAALDDYLADAREAYELGVERFVYPDRSRLRDMIDPAVARSGRALPLLRTMDDHVQRYVSHPKLRQLLEYTLVFLGGSPYNTPGLYSMLSHADLNLGVFYPDGGMYSVVEGLRELAETQGVTIHTGEPVERIRLAGHPAGRDTATPFERRYAVETADRRTPATTVVANANPAHVERDVLDPDLRRHDPDYWDDRTLAPSAFMLYLGVEGSVDPLEHHTLVLPTDWDAHFEAIFDEPRWPTDPAYYVSVPSVTDETVAPEGGETVVVLVPVAPSLDDSPTARARYREQVLDDLADHTGVELRDRIVTEHTACVSEFADRLGAPGGTALGLAHTLTQTGPLRPGHRGGAPGLYFTGSYTTPGIGVPMALLSGTQAADAVRTDADTDRLLPASVTLPF
ncbi:MAG: phytoene desaturase family protein [Halobaculum sp.]